MPDDPMQGEFVYVLRDEAGKIIAFATGPFADAPEERLPYSDPQVQAYLAAQQGPR